jgi:uncharacterized protein YndB with AHSA1/START domain
MFSPLGRNRSRPSDGLARTLVKSSKRTSISVSGGEYHFRATSPQMGEFSMRGEYREVIPPAKLFYTWQIENDPDFVDRETRVTVEFLDIGDSTEVRLTHENLPSADSVKNHEHGWSVSFDKLEKMF